MSCFRSESPSDYSATLSVSVRSEPPRFDFQGKHLEIIWRGIGQSFKSPHSANNLVFIDATSISRIQADADDID